MSVFTKHDEKTAPDGARETLMMAKQRYGFVPNLAAYVAQSPEVLGAILKLSEIFDNTSLSAQEQQVVLLTVSALNDCNYCRTVHTALGKSVLFSDSQISEIVSFKVIDNLKLNTLRDFTKSLVEEKGRLSHKQVQEFLDAGYTRAQVFEVIMGVALKTMTNYSNHLAGAEPNEEFLSMAAGKAA